MSGQVTSIGGGNAVTLTGDPNLIYYQDKWQQLLGDFQRALYQNTEDLGYIIDEDEDTDTDPEIENDDFGDCDDGNCIFDQKHYYEDDHAMDSQATGRTVMPAEYEIPAGTKPSIPYYPREAKDVYDVGYLYPFPQAKYKIPVPGVTAPPEVQAQYVQQPVPPQGQHGAGGARSGGPYPQGGPRPAGPYTGGARVNDPYAPTKPMDLVKESEHANQCFPADICKDGKLLGANLLGKNQVVYSHRKLYQTREPGTKVENIMVGPSMVTDLDGDAGEKAKKFTQQFAKYQESLYSTPTLDGERRISTGVVMNPWSGQMYETFEDDLPPPNTDKAMLPQQFAHTNPRLVSLQGMLDKNRPEPTKREVCKGIPGPDGGSNVWGDQLYADRRRNEQQQRAERDVWHNRDGDEPVEKAWDRKPVGYVGFQRAYTMLPYLPPTQQLDNKDWKGTHDVQGVMPVQAKAVMERCQGDPKLAGECDPYRIVPRVITKKSDLSQCPRAANVGPVEDQGGNVGATIPQQDAVRFTQKTLMSEEFPTVQGNLAGDGDTVRQQDPARFTLKSGMVDVEYPTVQGNLAGDGDTLRQQDPARFTLKSGMVDVEYPTTQANLAGDGNTIPFQGELHMTKKPFTVSVEYPTVTAALPDAGQTGFPMTGKVEEHNYRGLVSTSAYFPISHVRWDNGAGWPGWEKSQHETMRGMSIPPSQPKVYGEQQTARWVPGFKPPCLPKGDREANYNLTHINRFGSITLADV